MNKNVTLVLSGGGARGIAHIGVIEELEHRGYTINSIAGTSMGALIGGVYAAGKLKEFKEWAYSMDRHDIFKLIDFTLSSHGLVKGDKVLKAMMELVPDSSIEELDIKYTATAFDVAHNKEVVFTRGSLYKAIRASISIPTVFTPVVSGKSVLVDGGVINNVPITNAIRTEGDTLIAVYVNADIPAEKAYLPKTEREKRLEVYTRKIADFRHRIFKDSGEDHLEKFNYFNLINNTITSMTNHISVTVIQNNPPDLLIEISRSSAGTFDFYKTEELVEIGRYAARKKLNTFENIKV